MAKAAAKTLISPFRLTSLLRAEKNPNLALELFKNPNPNCDPNPKPYRYSARSYDLIICKLGRAKKFEEMEQILSQMSQETRFSPKEALFCLVISFYGRAHMAGAAVKAFDQIPSFRCRRSIRSFNSLLNALLESGDRKKMAELSRDLEELNLKPDACTYNILIRSANSIDCALNLFDEMLKKGIEPSMVTFGTLISALCNNSKLDEAFKLKEEMSRLYNIEPNVFIYTALIKSLCKSGKLEEALSLKREISGLDSAVYPTIIRALFKAGRKGEVVETLEEMKKDCVEPDVVTYNAMIAGFCDDGDFDAALEAMNEMKKKGIKPDVVSYNTIISGFCKKGRAKDAVEVFEEMPIRECRPDVLSYKMIFEGLCDAKEFKQARLVLDEMVFNGYEPGEGSVRKFVEGFCGDGEWNVIVEVFCRLSKGRRGVFDGWVLVINSVLKERAKLEVEEILDCLI